MKNTHQTQALSVVILAAGQGKRMDSTLPKVLNLLAGKTMLERVVVASSALTSLQTMLVVYGYQGAMIQTVLSHFDITWVEQKERLGTGHAVLQALPFLPPENRVLILYGDVPLITEQTLKKFIDETPDDALGIIAANFPDPTGIGRIIRDVNENIIAVIEEKDADEAVRKIQEVNTGFYLVPAKFLHRWLPQLSNQNAQQEYYLTDIIAFAVNDNVPIHALQLATHHEVLGINDRKQLAQAEQWLQQFAK